jgi:alpha-galactosidase
MTMKPLRRSFSALCATLATLTAPVGAVAADPPGAPVKVFILAGQSNMEGKAKMSLVEYQAKQPETKALFAHFRKDDQWIERDDVAIKFLDRKGKLTVGFGSPNCIGPELQFGWTVGDRFAEPVLLIKTAWGGCSLWRDFRPPSAGLPPDATLQKMLADAQKRKPETTLDEIKQGFGASYRAMREEVSAALADLKNLVPGYAGQGHVLAGFAWFQGWNDMINADYTAEYAVNLAHFIRDVRRDLKSPQLPFAVAQMGVDGLNANDGTKRFKDAQAAGVDHAEFKGNVALVKTDVLWDTEADAVFRKGWREHREEWDKVGSDYPYHYLGSAKCLCRIGKALADALLDLGAGKQ